jgi:hypothetical protein
MESQSGVSEERECSSLQEPDRIQLVQCQELTQDGGRWQKF